MDSYSKKEFACQAKSISKVPLAWECESLQSKAEGNTWENKTTLAINFRFPSIPRGETPLQLLFCQRKLQTNMLLKHIFRAFLFIYNSPRENPWFLKSSNPSNLRGYEILICGGGIFEISAIFNFSYHRNLSLVTCCKLFLLFHQSTFSLVKALRFL